MDDELLACGHHPAGIMRCPNCGLVVCACCDTDDPHRCIEEPVPPPLSFFGAAMQVFEIFFALGLIGAGLVAGTVLLLIAFG